MTQKTLNNLIPANIFYLISWHFPYPLQPHRLPFSFSSSPSSFPPQRGVFHLQVYTSGDQKNFPHTNSGSVWFYLFFFFFLLSNFLCLYLKYVLGSSEQLGCFFTQSDHLCLSIRVHSPFACSSCCSLCSCIDHSPVTPSHP